MKEFFEQYESLYTNNGIEGWVLWISLWIQYVGYYVCFYIGFLLLVLLCVLPLFSLFGLVHTVKIKIKHKKQKKQQDKLKHKIQTDYINTLDEFTKKKKKKHK